jgi:hypothetical protein
MGTDLTKVTIESVALTQEEYRPVVRQKNGRTIEGQPTWSEENAKHVLAEEMERATSLTVGGFIKRRVIVYGDWEPVEGSDIELLTEEVTDGGEVDAGTPEVETEGSTSEGRVEEDVR